LLDELVTILHLSVSLPYRQLHYQIRHTC